MVSSITLKITKIFGLLPIVYLKKSEEDSRLVGEVNSDQQTNISERVPLRLQVAQGLTAYADAGSLLILACLYFLHIFFVCVG